VFAQRQHPCIHIPTQFFLPIRTRPASVRVGIAFSQSHLDIVPSTHVPPLIQTRSAGFRAGTAFLQPHSDIVSSTHALLILRTSYAGVRAGTTFLRPYPDVVSPAHLSPSHAHALPVFAQASHSCSHILARLLSIILYLRENALLMFVRGLQFCLHIATLFLLHCPSLTLAWVQSTPSHMLVPFIDFNLSVSRLQLVSRRHSRMHASLQPYYNIVFSAPPSLEPSMSMKHILTLAYLIHRLNLSTLRLQFVSRRHSRIHWIFEATSQRCHLSTAQL
jgi:hypothetical protein